VLAVGGQGRDEEEQQHRGDEQRGKARKHQHAGALRHRGLQRRPERDGEDGAAEQPDAGADREQGVGVEGGAAPLHLLKHLADAGAIVIGGA
ncbi:hypothetical protein CYQ40_15275, partial [Enterococcus faecalis]